ncbi:EutN/CcmL family microcompartment protein [uncultured Fusobacterium sp.]|uniref:EutN/CcmL family microcompartment protein n=1 Tax=uncultured Fusobacterium sp. TaxID=159267 RepID=UPI0025D13B68|nr:EutN/CcmL family microcompartment protein [uncultured Fusobacterium sp.]
MFLAKVVGKVVSTTKDEGLNGKKVLVVAPIDMDGNVISDKRVVSIDSVGAGIGDQVLVTTGSVSAYPFAENGAVAIDSAIVAIIDTIEKN